MADERPHEQQLSEPSRHILVDLLGESREEILRADTKASILFGLFSITFGVVLAGLIAGHWSPTDLLDGVQWLWWLGAAAAAAAMVLLGVAIWPRITHPEDREEVAYFAHVAQFKLRNDFRAAVEHQATKDPDGRTVDQVHVISKIATRKYRLIQSAIVALAVAAICTLSAVLIDAVAG